MLTKDVLLTIAVSCYQLLLYSLSTSLTKYLQSQVSPTYIYDQVHHIHLENMELLLHIHLFESRPKIPLQGWIYNSDSRRDG